MTYRDIFKYTFFIYLNVFSLFAVADEALVDFGLGVSNSGKTSPAETRFLAIGVQEDMWGCVKSRYTLGGWLDSAGNGRRSSSFMAAQLGVEIRNGMVSSSLFSGPSLISNPDSYLGSTFEFYNSLNFGMYDKSDNYIGLMYRHISNAGLSSINIGRDVLGLELKFGF